ncbi:MAG: hypothetical protein U0821_20330 [Chloroflexota bacterium]
MALPGLRTAPAVVEPLMLLDEEGAPLSGALGRVDRSTATITLWDVEQTGTLLQRQFDHGNERIWAVLPNRRVSGVLETGWTPGGRVWRLICRPAD